MKTKFCTCCQSEKSIKDFRKNKSKRDGLQSKCIECDKEYARRYYQANKKHCLQRTKRNTQRLIQEYKEWKGTLECAICDEKDPICIDLHHLDSSEKEINISTIGCRDGLTNFLKKEIEKCIPVCANCHRKIHKYNLENFDDVAELAKALACNVRL